MKLLTTIIFIGIALTAIAQNPATRKWVDTEVKFTDSVGNVVMVHNSFPKGGGSYTDAAGTKYSYVIFWFRLINESAAPLELAMKFPTDPIKIFSSPASYIKLFLPPDTMTHDKIQLNDYGLTNLQSFLKGGFNKPSKLQRTINPKEEYLFYVPVIFYQASGTTRAALVLKGKDLFFKIRITPDVDAVLIPCGRIVYKD